MLTDISGVHIFLQFPAYTYRAADYANLQIEFYPVFLTFAYKMQEKCIIDKNVDEIQRAVVGAQVALPANMAVVDVCSEVVKRQRRAHSHLVPKEWQFGGYRNRKQREFSNNIDNALHQCCKKGIESTASHNITVLTT